MKTIKETLEFCIAFTFCDRYNFERVIEPNHVRDCINNVLSEGDHLE